MILHQPCLDPTGAFHRFDVDGAGGKRGNEQDQNGDYNAHHSPTFLAGSRIEVIEWVMSNTERAAALT